MTQQTAFTNWLCKCRTGFDYETNTAVIYAFGNTFNAQEAFEFFCAHPESDPWVDFVETAKEEKPTNQLTIFDLGA